MSKKRRKRKFNLRDDPSDDPHIDWMFKAVMTVVEAAALVVSSIVWASWKLVCFICWGAWQRH